MSNWVARKSIELLGEHFTECFCRNNVEKT